MCQNSVSTVHCCFSGKGRGGGVIWKSQFCRLKTKFKQKKQQNSNKKLPWRRRNKGSPAEQNPNRRGSFRGRSSRSGTSRSSSSGRATRCRAVLHDEGQLGVVAHIVGVVLGAKCYRPSGVQDGPGVRGGGILKVYTQGIHGIFIESGYVGIHMMYDVETVHQIHCIKVRMNSGALG